MHAYVREGSLAAAHTRKKERLDRRKMQTDTQSPREWKRPQEAAAWLALNAFTKKEDPPEQRVTAEESWSRRSHAGRRLAKRVETR